MRKNGETTGGKMLKMQTENKENLVEIQAEKSRRETPQTRYLTLKAGTTKTKGRCETRKSVRSVADSKSRCGQGRVGMRQERKSV